MALVSMNEDDDDPRANAPDIYSVSRLNTQVRELLEGTFSRVWVEGEISNMAKPRSGHFYFTLKDEQAQVRCAMFRSQNRLLDFDAASGTQVLLRGRVSLYRERGDYQLIADYMELAGAGALRRRFELLRNQLAEEGLFDPASKRPLPPFPNRIGIITSPTGAAVRDVLKVLQSRCPSLEVVIYPTRVQGEGSAREIAQAIARADSRAECDLLLLVRGGGSLEDLWAFNEEQTARAIFACRLPIISGVGHETDVTIADFVADARAPTPSVAAEMGSPNHPELRARLERVTNTLRQRMRADLLTHRRDMERAARRVRHPRQLLDRLAQRSDDQLMRLGRGVHGALARYDATLTATAKQLDRAGPVNAITRYDLRSNAAAASIASSIRHQLASFSTHLKGVERTFHSVSPARVLERGYAMVTNAETGEILRDAAAVTPGTQIRAQLAQGTLVSTVDAPAEE
ncbi:MAG: exodeoxyribonuclease VII large subunit [Gammaproteobacteria bacterium]|jgi:exodeoxyribonuclease VII large subunit